MTTPELPELPIGYSAHEYSNAIVYTGHHIRDYAAKAIEQDRKVRAAQELPVVATMFTHVTGRKKVQITGENYFSDQDAGWGHKQLPLCDHTLAMQRIQALEAEIERLRGR